MVVVVVIVVVVVVLVGELEKLFARQVPKTHK